MAISVTNIGTGATATGVSTVAVTIPIGGVPALASIVVAVNERSSTGTLGSISDTVNSYSSVVSANMGGAIANGFGAIYLAFGVSALTSGNTITYTKGGANNGAISCLYVTGVSSGISPLDGAVTNSATGSTAGNQPVTGGAPGQAGELVLAAAATRGSSGTFTNDGAFATPFNEATSGTGTAGARINGGNFLNAGSSATTYTPNFTAGSTWATLIIALKPGGAIISQSASVSQAQTTTVFRGNHGKFASISSAQSVLMLRKIGKIVSTPLAQSINVVRALTHIIQMLSGQSVALRNGVGKRLSSTMSNTMALITLLSKPSIIVMTSAQSISIRRFISKTVALLAPESISVRNAITHTITMLSGQSASLIKRVLKPIVSITSGQTVALQRTVGKRLVVTSGQLVSRVRLVSKNIQIGSAERVAIIKRSIRLVVITFTQSQVMALLTRTNLFAIPRQVLINVVRRFRILRSQP